MNEKTIQPFMLYFPYILLILAIVLFSIERLFKTVIIIDINFIVKVINKFKASREGAKLEKFHTLLVR